jgi:hypothetical protein
VRVPNVPNEFVSGEGTSADEVKSPSAETEDADADVLLLDDQDGNVDPNEIIGADIEKEDT